MSIFSIKDERTPILKKVIDDLKQEIVELNEKITSMEKIHDEELEEAKQKYEEYENFFYKLLMGSGLWNLFKELKDKGKYYPPEVRKKK